MAETQPAQWSVQADRFVAARPETLWRVITDLEGMAEHLPGIIALERLSDDGPGAYRPGTRWRETRRVFGQQATEEMEVVVAEPHRRTEILAVSRGVRHETGFRLDPAGNGPAPQATHLRFFFTARPDAAAVPAGSGLGARLRRAAGRALGRASAPLGAAATRRQMVQELEHIGRRAEHLAAGGA